MPEALMVKLLKNLLVNLQLMSGDEPSDDESDSEGESDGEGDEEESKEGKAKKEEAPEGHETWTEDTQREREEDLLEKSPERKYERSGGQPTILKWSFRKEHGQNPLHL